MMVGGAIGGVLGDKFGRRVALLGSVITFGVLTIGVAFANSIPILVTLRFLAGLGLGGAMPSATAIVSEYVPRRKRPVAVTLIRCTASQLRCGKKNCRYSTMPMMPVDIVSGTANSTVHMKRNGMSFPVRY